jgi:hypothetical protein
MHGSGRASATTTASIRAAGAEPGRSSSVAPATSTAAHGDDFGVLLDAPPQEAMEHVSTAPFLSEGQQLAHVLLHDGEWVLFKRLY